MANGIFVTLVGKNLTYKMKNLYSLCYMACYMAKLYWRIKQNGKWTWQAAAYDLHIDECTHPDGEVVTLWWPTVAGISEHIDHVEAIEEESR